MKVTAPYAPDFRIDINGKALPVAVRSTVSGVRFQNGLEAADRVEIDIANPDLRWLRRHVRGLGVRPFPSGVRLGTVGGVKTQPDGLFDVANRLRLSLGYQPGGVDAVFDGDVTGLDASFPSGGLPTIRLVAHSRLHRLSQGTEARGFGLLPDFVVASILAAESRLIPQIDPSIIGASTAVAALKAIFSGTGTKQGGRGEGETNLAFLKRLAKDYDADFWVDGDRLHLSGFRAFQKPAATLSWGGSLLEFSPRVSTVGQVAGVGLRLSLREIPLSFTASVAWDFDRGAIVVDVTPGAGPVKLKTGGGAESPVSGLMTLVDKSVKTPTDVIQHARYALRKLRETVNTRVTGSGSAVGNPQIRAGATVRLEGLGPDFSGDYKVTSATHTIDTGGYRTNFDVRKEIIP